MKQKSRTAAVDRVWLANYSLLINPTVASSMLLSCLFSILALTLSPVGSFYFHKSILLSLQTLRFLARVRVKRSTFKVDSSQNIRLFKVGKNYLDLWICFHLVDLRSSSIREKGWGTCKRKLRGSRIAERNCCCNHNASHSHGNMYWKQKSKGDGFSGRIFGWGG